MCIYPCIDEHIGKLEIPIKVPVSKYKIKDKNQRVVSFYFTQWFTLLATLGTIPLDGVNLEEMCKWGDVAIKLAFHLRKSKKWQGIGGGNLSQGTGTGGKPAAQHDAMVKQVE